MAILTLQQRSRELGRIRLGQFVTPKGAKGRPEKLDRFRFTSLSEPLIGKVATLYGGTPQPWVPQGGGAEGFEVIADCTRIPILVPPQPVSQYFELWSGGGCVRRCDGQTELLSGGQCLCGVDPDDRECKPTTRLRVVLRDVEGIGVWRLESHGYYSATELPEVAEFLAQAGGYVSAHLGLEERVIKREGKTRRFMVPTIEVDVTPAQLLSGAVPSAQLGAGRQAPALTTGPSAAELATSYGGLVYEPEPEPAALDVESVRAAIAAAQTVPALRDMWPLAVEAGLTGLAKDRAADIERAEREEAARDSGDPGELWATIMTTVPADWSTDQVEDDFERVTGTDAGSATAEQMQTYLTHLSAKG